MFALSTRILTNRFENFSHTIVLPTITLFPAEYILNLELIT